MEYYNQLKLDRSTQSCFMILGFSVLKVGWNLHIEKRKRFALEKGLIICGKFRESLKVIYIIATKNSSLGTNRYNK